MIKTIKNPLVLTIIYSLWIVKGKIIPTPQAARYNATGDPNPPASTTRIEDFNRFDSPTTNK